MDLKLIDRPDRITGWEALQNSWGDFTDWLQDDPNKLEDLKNMAIGAAEGVWDTISVPRRALEGEQISIEEALGVASMAMGAGLPMRAPEGSLRVFAGRNSKTANRGFGQYADDNPYNQAVDMYTEGRSPEEIWQKTGWEPDTANGVWQYEIDPDDTQINFKGEMFAQDNDLTDLEQWEDFAFSVSHMLKDVESISTNITKLIDSPELFEAYPILKGTELTILKDDGTSVGGYFKVTDETYTPSMMDPDDLFEQSPLLSRKKPHIAISERSLDSPDEFMEVLHHELQHAVQAIEGWDGGANTRFMAEQFGDQIWDYINKNFPELDALDKTIKANQIARMMYRTNTGEIEARAAADRATMLTPEERLETPPSHQKGWDVYDEEKVWAGRRMPTFSLPVEYPPELKGER